MSNNETTEAQRTSIELLETVCIIGGQILTFANKNGIVFVEADRLYRLVRKAQMLLEQLAYPKVKGFTELRTNPVISDASYRENDSDDKLPEPPSGVLLRSWDTRLGGFCVVFRDTFNFVTARGAEFRLFLNDT